MKNTDKKLETRSSKPAAARYTVSDVTAGTVPRRTVVLDAATGATRAHVNVVDTAKFDSKTPWRMATPKTDVP